MKGAQPMKIYDKRNDEQQTNVLIWINKPNTKLIREPLALNPIYRFVLKVDDGGASADGVHVLLDLTIAMFTSWLRQSPPSDKLIKPPSPALHELFHR